MAEELTNAAMSATQMQLVERLMRRKIDDQPLERIRPLPPSARVPLTPAQARIWFFACLYPTSAEYHVFETLAFAVAPERPVLEAALRALVRRHDALRLRIVEVDGQPMQEACADVDVPLSWHDLGALDPKSAGDRARRIAAERVRAPFQLVTAPLFRVTSIRLPDGGCWVVLVLHHVVADFWSLSLLIEELGLLLSGKELPPPPSARFIDYVAWERERVDEARVERELEYWTRRLGGELPVLDLPKDRPRPALPTRGGHAVSCEVASETLGALQTLAREEGTTLFVVLLAAYKVLLYRVTGQSDLIVGTPLAGRDHPFSERILGCFVRTVALRTDLGGAPSFREVVRRVHVTTLEAQDHQTVPYDRVVAELTLAREQNYSPVFQTFFGVQSSTLVDCAGAAIGAVSIDSESAKWDLTVSLTETPRGLGGFIEYSADLFDEATVERFAAVYEHLLGAMLAEPDRPIRSYPLVSAEARERILELTPYEAPRHPYRTMAEPFEEQVRRTPDAVALVGEQGTLSYAELNRRANQLADFLREAGAGRGRFVGVCMERSFELVVALYAIAKSGAAYVPLDPELPDGRIAFMLADTEPLVVLVDASSRAKIAAGPYSVVSADDDAHRWAARNAEDVPCEGHAHDLVHLLYTSGSTGRPKAVAYPVDGAIADIMWLQRAYPFGPGDANLFKTSYGFDVSIWEIFWPLYFGAKLAICEPGGHRDPGRVAALLDRHGVTTIFLIPTFMQVFLDHVPAGSCRSLRWVFCGGEPVTPRIRDGFYARFGGKLINCYGPTEAGCVTDMVVPPAPGSPTVPLGRPAANFRVHVLDEDLEMVPIGVSGEAFIAGEVGLAHGYFKRPELTAERFLPDPFGAPGSRMYRTGDICRYREDGVLEHLGRSGRQVKIRGMRIELAEIETVLCEQGGIEDCAVLASDEPDRRLVAFVVPRGGTSVDARALTEHAARLLPRYMVPAAIVSVSEIPATVNGKIDRESLIARWRSVAPPPARVVVPPADEREEGLKRIFERVLGCEQVGVTDSFFDLGGHSLLIFKLISACAEELHVRPSVADVFSASSVRELGKRMFASSVAQSSLVPLFTSPGKPLVVFVHAASGSVLPFLEVAKRLEGEFSIFGLQAPDVVGDGEEYSIPTLAARYVAAVDAVRGMSPLVLAGWSMGGCVALEMARLWRATGVDVAALLMLDTWTPPSVLASPDDRRGLRDTILQLDVLGFEGFNRDDASFVDAFGVLERVLCRNRRAFLDYEPGWFDGTVDLLRAVDDFPDAGARFPDVYEAADRGWTSRIRDVVVHSIGGNHFTLLAKENAPALASAIRATIDARLSFSAV
ncbi:MAG: amino acid adenylation domain-containing protein [Labilithrix sp.]|nr:amino acid adenylation domain-containing protein [Labilithrix sp.]